MAANSKTRHVLIAGAGPVGMIAALVLAKAGMKVSLFERRNELAEDLRASTFHPPTLDMIARIDPTLTADLHAQGLIARHTQFRDRKAGLIAEFDGEVLRGDTDHPYRLQCEQWKMTRLIRERLKAFADVSLSLEAKVLGVEQDADGVTLKIDHAGEVRTHRGDWLIGADGAWSAVRTALGIEFEGFTYPERFYVASTKFDFAEVLTGLSLVNYISDPDEWCVILRVPGMWRVLFPTRNDETDEDVVSDASTEARLQGVWARPDRYETVHRTLYPVHQRVAKSYRSGRAFLAGDSAHINNPIGGMGMNGGVHDALNLCDKLIRVARGEDESLLDLYERQRRQIAIDFINANTARNKKTMEERDPEARKRNQDDMRRTAESPELARAFMRKTAMIDALRASEAIQ
jgi:3-(3-hydroxy-phenyl)propionate hydroxylase